MKLIKAYIYILETSHLIKRVCFEVILNQAMKTKKIIVLLSYFYAPNFEKVDGAYCFWSVRGCVGACVRACVRAWVTLFVPTVTFKPLKLES